MADRQPAMTDYAVAPGEYVQEWLQENDVTRDSLAYKLGVDVTYIDALLVGKIHMSTLVQAHLEELTGIQVKTWKIIEDRYQKDLDRIKNRAEAGVTSTTE